MATKHWNCCLINLIKESEQRYLVFSHSYCAKKELGSILPLSKASLMINNISLVDSSETWIKTHSEFGGEVELTSCKYFSIWVFRRLAFEVSALCCNFFSHWISILKDLETVLNCHNILLFTNDMSHPSRASFTIFAHFVIWTDCLFTCHASEISCLFVEINWRNKIRKIFNDSNYLIPSNRSFFNKKLPNLAFVNFKRFWLRPWHKWGISSVRTTVEFSLF